MYTSPGESLKRVTTRPLRSLSGYLTGLVKGRLWLKVLVGMFLGLVTGTLLGPGAGLVEAQTGATVGSWLAFPGKLFIAAIQMIVVPLVIASVARGLAGSEDLDQLRRLGVRASLFFAATTAIAASIGLWVAYLFKPGMLIQDLPIDRSAVSEQTAPALPTVSELPTMVVGLLPGNPLQSMVQGEMLQVVIFSVIIGIALVSMAQAQARPVLELLESVQMICMTVVRWAMRLAPYAVFGLMAQLASTIGFGVLLGMAFYVLTVLAGLLLMLVLYLLLLRLVSGVRPFGFLRDTRDVLLLAFSTSSSAAVMPLSIRTAEDKLKVRASISQFVIPLGATINMNGTALYQAVATVFLAQVYGVDLGWASLALVVAVAVGASIGSPATPGVGIVILSMVLGSVGIPAAGIALIMGVDRILDMSRTAINVAGDLVACRLMETFAGVEPERAPAPEPVDTQG